jgi:hypothetical protein
LGGFAQATVFRFAFTVTTAETLTVNHDDGISLFVAGTESMNCTIASCAADLLPTSAAEPTSAELTSVVLGPGTYDLWFAEVNGLPGVLQASSIAEVPLPAAFPLFATGLGAFGLLGWRRKKKAAAIAA